MRISCSIPVSGKVFCCSNYACVLRAFSESDAKTSDITRILTIRAHIDYRIRSVVIHIDNGCIDLLHSECKRLASCDRALAAGVFRISRRTHGHVPGEVYGVVETHAGARFEIGRYQERIFRQLLHAVHEHN